MLRLYRIPFSTNVERVALALAHKALPVESIWVEPSNRTEVERVSGQPLVPVLVDGDDVVVDSTRILEYLDERYPDLPLYPPERARRAEMRVFIDWFDRVWKRPPNEIEAELSKPRPDHARVEALGRQMREWLDLFESMLAGRAYLMGELSAADCAAFPFVKYARGREAGDDELFHRILEEHQPLREEHRALRAWIERVDEHPRA